jgi:biopolymer transport protein ExbD
MPVKLQTQLPGDHAEARIEIIPLIDIMFFLLASFMLVSLSMVSLKTLEVNLPTAVSSNSESKRDFVSVTVDQAGSAYLNGDKTPIEDNQVVAALVRYKHANPNVRIIISGDAMAHHGDVIHVLDLVRLAGIDKVAFQIRQTASGAKP